MADAPERIRVAQDADGFWTCREAVSGSQEYVRADLYAALEAKLAEKEAEKERLKEDATSWSMEASRYAKVLDKAREREAEALSRTGAVKGEWHRADGDKSILLYTLRQDGWSKGEAVMVNDVTVRIEAANGSEAPIEPIASAILSALTTEPAAPEGQQRVDKGVWKLDSARAPHTEGR